MPDHSQIQKLEKFATECRISAIKMIAEAGCGHPGSSLSATDLMVALYEHYLRMDPKNPRWEERDRFVLSKGHGVPTLYAILATKGILDPSELATFRQVDSRLQGHPDRARFPFAEASTGSLGQGLSIAQGIAMGLKHRGSDARVYCLMGDGETQEGQVWEAALSAPKFKLNNLVAILDNNNGQIDGYVDKVMDLAPIADKWRAFRWVVHEIDGHNYEEILNAFEMAKKETERPTLIWAKTVKGKGVSFMENEIGWHGIAPNAEQTKTALAELEGRLSK